MPAPDGRCQPTIALALAGSLDGFRAASRLTRMHDAVAAAGIDVDLGPRQLRHGLSGFVGHGPIAVWLPDDAMHRASSGSGLTFTLPTAQSDAVTIVLPFPVGMEWRPASLTLAARLVSDAAEQFGNACVPTIGLRPAQLVGGRRHLTDMSVLRRVCEEWGIRVAIDATTVADLGWEAEAAVARLGTRLGMLRIGTRGANSHATGHDRVARRALAAAIDAPQPVTISLLPQPGLLWRFSVDRCADAWCASAAWLSDYRSAVLAFRRDSGGDRGSWRPSQARID